MVGLTNDCSLTIFSRPYGTFRVSNLYPGLRPGLSSAVPAGLGFVMLVLPYPKDVICGCAVRLMLCASIIWAPDRSPGGWPGLLSGFSLQSFYAGTACTCTGRVNRCTK